MPGLGIGEVAIWEDLGVELLTFDILSFEPLAVDLIDLVEFLARLGLKSGKGLNCLGARARRSTRKSILLPTPDFINL